MSTNFCGNDLRHWIWTARQISGEHPPHPDVQGWQYRRLWRLRHRLIRWRYGWTFHRWLVETTPDGRIWRKSLL